MLDWPLAELLLALRERLRREAAEAYRTEMLVWSSLAPHAAKKLSPPTPPDVLRK